jgi:hypothetical protein
VCDGASDQKGLRVEGKKKCGLVEACGHSFIEGKKKCGLVEACRHSFVEGKKKSA